MRLPTDYFHKQCPFCGSDRIRRTARHGFFERSIYPMLNAYPYRCEKCSHRMLMFIGRQGVIELTESR